MPNTGHKWTKDEDIAVINLTWVEFNDRYNGATGLDITYDAFRFRKAKLLREQAAIAEVLAGQPDPLMAQSGPPDTYIGPKVLYLDVETTFSTQPRILYAATADGWGRITQFRRDDYPGRNMLIDDADLVDAYARHLETADIWYSWNGKGFDIPVINARLAKHGRRPLESRMHADLMWYASQNIMRLGRRSLDSVSRYFGTSTQKTPLDVDLWDRAVSGDPDAYEEIVAHCDADVEVLRETFQFLRGKVLKYTR
jgi:uncharacterized protein YprB with RNaseH-like and TPR domain